jgi:hypothetical protein
MASAFSVLRNRLQEVNRPIVCDLDDESQEDTGHDWVPLEILVGFVLVLAFLCQVK